MLPWERKIYEKDFRNKTVRKREKDRQEALKALWEVLFIAVCFVFWFVCTVILQ